MIRISKTTLVVLVAMCLAIGAMAQDEHWSRQFKKPVQSTKMSAATGLSDGTTKPTIENAKWHDGKLWMCGAWETGVDAETGGMLRNQYWYLWNYSETDGYQPVCWFHNTKGGMGPDGRINDFLWLPDGRLVVAGEFTRLDNMYGNMYHRVNALAIYDPAEPSADKWKPLGTFFYNGTVSDGGSIYCIAYDPQGNDLYIGGTFGGIRGGDSPFIHYYDFDTESFVPMTPAVGGQKPAIRVIQVDTRTNPSTIWLGGKFHWGGGDDRNGPMISSSKNRWTTGLIKFQAESGWTTFPEKTTEERFKHLQNGPLQRAADFMFFDSVNVHDLLLDGDDIWIVGSFSEGEGTGQTLRGVAKWDAKQQMWIDPTGKGGVGREIWDIEKADNGKIYFAGAFGGRNGVDKTFDGFKDGTEAHCAISYDPSTNTWAQLGSGLSSHVFPEVRMCVNGNDVYYVGDFHYIGHANFGPKADKSMESWFIARWNETRDFVADPIKAPDTNTAKPFYSRETGPRFEGNEHWSRAFPRPPRAVGSKTQMSGKTGADDGKGTPDPSSITKHGDTLYFTGSWQADINGRWYVWTWNAEKGWNPIAWEERGKEVGPCSIPEGGEWRDGKFYVYGAISKWGGIAVYDPAANSWSKFTSNFNGQEVIGHGLESGGVINDIEWDERNGDMYLVGSCGLKREGATYPSDVAPVFKVDAEGNLHLMGTGFYPEIPGKPVVVANRVCVDETTEPSTIYVGGTFGYHGPTPTKQAQLAYNIVKWDYEGGDWKAFGKGVLRGRSELDVDKFPEGLPGLPAKPGDYPYMLRTDFPRIQCMVHDTKGNLYIGGTLAVLHDSLPVKDRAETYAIVRYNKTSNEFEPCTNTKGFSRDVLNMTWLSETELLLSGAFEYDGNFRCLNGVATLDTATGEVKGLGGGLMRDNRSQVIAPMVVHCVDGDNWYFAGLFDHAGINGNDRLLAPVQSNYLAMYNRTQNLDPNRGLKVEPVDAIEGPGGFSSKQVKLTLTASTDAGTLTWYERRSNGDFAKKGEGESVNIDLRVKGTDTEVVYYVTVTRDGVEGGKQPVRVEVKQPE
ncbi:MAG: hypothetical protein R3E76_13215 [Planctomycetota bacterium]